MGLGGVFSRATAQEPAEPEPPFEPAGTEISLRPAPVGPVITPPAPPPSLPSSQSVSGQFFIWGSEPLRRTAFATHCDQIREDFAEIIGAPSRWRFNIHVRIHEERDEPGKAVRRAVPSIKPVEVGGYLFRLELLVDEEFDPEEFERELVRLLLLEQAYAPHKNAKFDRLPPWLLNGVIELMHYRRAGRPSEIFKTIVNAHQVVEIDELMKMDPEKATDAFSSEIYRACSAALVRSLLDQGGGEARMRAFLEDLAIDDSETNEVLKRHFPNLREDEASIARWWALQVAAMSERSALEQLSLARTEEFLTRALVVRMPGVEARADPVPVALAQPLDEEKPGLLGRFRKNREDEPEEAAPAFQQGSIHDFELFLDHPQAAAALALNREQLLNLQKQAFPGYRNLIGGYSFVVSRLIEGETKGMAEQLAALDAQRIQIQQRMAEIGDFMNWFEATQVQAPHDAFEAYERALQRIKALEEERRDDPVSRYLDAIEKEYEP